MLDEVLAEAVAGMRVVVSVLPERRPVDVMVAFSTMGRAHPTSSELFLLLHPYIFSGMCASLCECVQDAIRSPLVAPWLVCVLPCVLVRVAAELGAGRDLATCVHTGAFDLHCVAPLEGGFPVDEVCKRDVCKVGKNSLLATQIPHTHPATLTPLTVCGVGWLWRRLGGAPRGPPAVSTASRLRTCSVVLHPDIHEVQVLGAVARPRVFAGAW
jgi:hypothetical protein